MPASSPTPIPSAAWVPVVQDFGIFPNWSSDGAGIYHFSLRDGYMCAWLQTVDPRLEASDRAAAPGAALPSATAEGRQPGDGRQLRRGRRPLRHAHRNHRQYLDAGYDEEIREDQELVSGERGVAVR